MKRQPRNKQNRAVTNSRSLRIESLEDRKLLTVAAEMVQMPQESQIGSEHWPEPAAEIAVEKLSPGHNGLHNNGAFRGPQETGFSRGLHNNGAFRDRQESGFSRGLHNNGAFREPTGHILWNASDDSETSNESYTDSGRITYYAYELKNVLLTSARDRQGNDKSLLLGVPSCPEVASNWQDRNNVGDKTWNEVLEDVVCFEDGPNESSGLVDDTIDSFTPTTDLPDGDYYWQVDEYYWQVDELLSPVTENQFSLNFEEIKVTYRDDVHDAKTETVCADEDGSQEDMKQESEANAEARLWQRVDRVMSRLTPGGLLGGGDEDPGQPSEDDLPVFGDDDDVTDPNYKEDEQGGPADPLNDPRQNDNDEDEDDQSNEDERWKRMAEDWTRMLNHLSN